MKVIAIQLIVLSLAIVYSHQNLLCSPFTYGCYASCLPFPYECTSTDQCICTATQGDLNLTVPCTGDNFVSACGALCTQVSVPPLFSITTECINDVCTCVYSLL